MVGDKNKNLIRYSDKRLTKGPKRLGNVSYEESVTNQNGRINLPVTLWAHDLERQNQT